MKNGYCRSCINSKSFIDAKTRKIVGQLLNTKIPFKDQSGILYNKFLDMLRKKMGVHKWSRMIIRLKKVSIKLIPAKHVTEVSLSDPGIIDDFSGRTFFEYTPRVDDQGPVTDP